MATPACFASKQPRLAVVRIDQPLAGRRRRHAARCSRSHARAVALEQLAELLAELRQLPGVIERKPGIFYRGSQAFLHFHEDPTGLFADARLDGRSFERFGISSREEARRFTTAVRKALGVQE